MLVFSTCGCLSQKEWKIRHHRRTNLYSLSSGNQPESEEATEPPICREQRTEERLQECPHAVFRGQGTEEDPRVCPRTVRRGQGTEEDPEVCPCAGSRTQTVGKSEDQTQVSSAKKWQGKKGGGGTCWLEDLKDMYSFLRMDKTKLQSLGKHLWVIWPQRNRRWLLWCQDRGDLWRKEGQDTRFWGLACFFS